MPSASTNFSVSGTGTNGCPSPTPATASITVKPSPTITVNSGGVCDGETFTITPSGAPQYSFSTPFTQVTAPPGIYSYTVTGLNANGCESAPVISSLTVHTLPQMTVTPARSFMCTGETNTVTATGGVTYTWTTGSTGVTYTISPGATTSVTVIGTDINGCQGKGGALVKVSGCTALNEFEDLVLTASPNPFSGLLRIRTELHSAVSITDITGRVIYRNNLAGETDIDLSHYPAGLYFLTADGPMPSVIKLIKE
jgi:hypothetical protein